MLLRGITGLAGGGALLAAVGVHAARHGGGNCSRNRAANGNGHRGVGRRRVCQVLDRTGHAALGAARRLAVGGLAALGSVTALGSTVLSRRQRSSRSVARSSHTVGAVQNGLRLGGQLPGMRFRSGR